MAQSARPELDRAGTTQQSTLSRSSRLDSLAAIAASSSPASPSSFASSSPSNNQWDSSNPHSSSSTPPTSASMSQGASTSQVALPNSLDSQQLSPRQTYANSTHSSHSSTRTNTGFVITSRTKNYAPPASPRTGAGAPFTNGSGASSPSWFNPAAHPSSSSSTTLYPPPIPSGSGLLQPGFPPSLGSRRGSSPAALPSSSRERDPAGSGWPSPTTATAEPKTTLTLSSSIDAKGRRMVNQYVRLKTIGQGSHGKVWLCAEPTIRESDEDELDEEGEAEQDGQDGAGAGDGRERRRRKRTPSERWEDDIDQDRVRYCAIKSVARDGPGRNKSLRAAKGKKASSQGSAGIGADDKVKREVAIMKRLDHPNIVRLKEVIDDAKSKKVFMVLEFMAGGQVVWQDDNKQPTMTVDEARRTFRDVVLGLEYLHYQGIIHRDIKPANLLWTADHKTVKISDFGVSHVSDALLRCSADDPSSCSGHDDDKALRKTAGSPAFFAPELCFPVDYTPTPNAHPSTTLNSRGNPSPEGDAYFPYGIDSSHLTPPTSSTPSQSGSGGQVYSPPASPNGQLLSSQLISLPLPPPSPSKPRSRPPVGRGIDVWALGVTLYCLLFGDTPFTARTEYELYNVIVREPVRVPLKMGVEGAWTGVPPGFEGCGDGTEGREVVDLLGRLLEKDPTKRIKLDEVKKHPWVLRNLSSPDSWLHSTDPGRIDHVTITEEDVQHATQERGEVDTLPPIRNRPGIRRALNAALSRFPAFTRIKSTRTTASTNSEDTTALGAHERERRSRSKSNSSNGHSGLDSAFTSESATTVSRQPSDGSKPKTGGKHEFLDLRRIISGASHATASATEPGTPRSPSPAAATAGNRGGWGNRSSASRKSTADSITSPTSTFPELARSISSSSVLGGPGSSGGARGHFSHHLFGRKVSDNDSTRSGSSVAPTPPSPYADSDPASGNSGGRQRTLSRMLSRLGGGGGGSFSSSNASLAGSNGLHSRSNSGVRCFVSGAGDGGAPPSRRVSAETDESAQEVMSVATMGVDPAVVEQFEAQGDRGNYDALGRLVVAKPKLQASNASDSKTLASGLTAAKQELDAVEGAEEEGEDLEEGAIDLTEFEYSESDDDDDDDDDDLDDFMRPALASANHLSGWKSPDFGDFRLGVRSPSEDDGQGGLYTSSAGGTPPTDELDPLDEHELHFASSPRPARKPSPPQPDNVSYAFVPLDYQFLPPSSPLQRLAFHRPPSNVSEEDEQQQQHDETTPRAKGPLLSPVSAQQYERTPSPSSPSASYSPLPHASRQDSYPLSPPLSGDESSPASFLRPPRPPPRDGSIRGVSLDPPSSSSRLQSPTGGKLAAAAALGRAWQEAQESDDGEEEMLVVPRRRRAATLSGQAPGAATGAALPPPPA
ncbi:hypothetical protein JCM8547_005953 [Rhodosporidiobolus lusitaniae]